MTPIDAGSRAERIVAAALWIGVAVCVATVAWGAWRGLDITDSGFYLLSARYPDEVLATVTSFHRYTAPVFAAVGHDVGWFRLAGLALVLVSALVLADGVRRYCAARAEAPSVMAGVSPLIVLGVLLQYAWGLPTPGYNLLNAAAVALSAGLLLSALTAAPEQRRAADLRFAEVGALVAVSLFCKVTTGLALIALYGLAPWILATTVPARRALMVMALGGIAWSALHFSLFESPAFWWASWQRGLGFTAVLGSGHGSGLALKYLHEGGVVVLATARRFWLVLVPFGIAAWLVSRGRPAAPLAAVALVLGSIIVAWRGYFGGMHIGGDGNLRNVLPCYVAIAGVTIGAVIVARAGPNRRQWSVVVWLTALALAGAVGTAVPLQLNVMLYFGPALAAVGLLLSRLVHGQGRSVALAVTGLFATSQIVTAGEAGPYRLSAPMSQQAEHTDIGVPARDLMLDAATSRFFISMRRIAAECGFRAGDDVLGFFWMPGVLFALGARAPGGTWFSAGYPGSRAVNEKLLDSLPPQRMRRAFILHKVASPEAMPDLVAHGLDFPAGYRRCGGATWPLTGQDVVMYRPAGREPASP